MTSHKLTLSKKLISAGTRIYYAVSGRDKAGNSAKSKLTSFKTKGYNAKIKVLDLSGKPVKGAKVTLLPGKSETIPAVLPLNRYSVLPVWRGKRFEPSPMFNEWHFWVFSETGKLIYKRKYEK